MMGKGIRSPSSHPLVLLGLAVWGLVPAIPVAAESTPQPFEVPPSLVASVGFWVRVYAEWGSSQVAIHDLQRQEVIYRVLDFTELEPSLSDSWPARVAKAQARDAAVKAAKLEVVEALKKLDETRPETAEGLKGILREAFLAWERDGSDPERFGQAAQRVRSQRGMKDRFASGYRQSGRYRGAVEAVLQQAGLPPGLVALVFTESLWELNARSHSGAVGPWQFLKGTGREYLFINDVVDERKDPILATHAASRYLRQSKQRLERWPVAITGYNFGMNGMARAVAAVGSADLEDILAQHDSPRFGFAARNYYAEFLAALHVFTNARHYFPGVQPEPPWVFDAVALPRTAQAQELWAGGVDSSALASLNPALTADALAGNVLFPKGFTLRVPAGLGASLLVHLASTRGPAEVQHKVVKARKGETLASLSRTHRVSMAELVAANSFAPGTKLALGQEVLIPRRNTGFTPLPEAVEAATSGSAVKVAFARPSQFAPHIPELTGQRPAPEPIMMSVDEAGLALAARTTRQPPPATTLTTTVPTAEDDGEGTLVVMGEPVKPSRGGAAYRIKRARWQVVAGPWSAEPDTEDSPVGVDVLAGAPELPEVDVNVGGTDGTPLVDVPVADPEERTPEI